jgi:hypothetical protein
MAKTKQQQETEYTVTLRIAGSKVKKMAAAAKKIGVVVGKVTSSQGVSSTSIGAMQPPRQWQGAEFPRFFYEGGISNTAAC